MSSCTVRGSPWHRRLLRDVAERLFSAPAGSPPGARYGAEVELLVLDGESGLPLTIFGEEGGGVGEGGEGGRGGSLAFLQAYGAPLGWRTVPGPHGAPGGTAPTPDTAQDQTVSVAASGLSSSPGGIQAQPKSPPAAPEGGYPAAAGPPGEGGFRG